MKSRSVNKNVILSCKEGNNEFNQNILLVANAIRLLSEYVKDKKRTDPDYDENRQKPWYRKKQITRDINDKIALDAQRFQICVNIFDRMLQKSKNTGCADLFEYLKKKMKNYNHFCVPASMMPYEFTSNMIEILVIVCRRNNLALQKLTGTLVKTMTKKRTKRYQDHIGNKTIYTLEALFKLSPDDLDAFSKVETLFHDEIDNESIHNGNSNILSAKNSNNGNFNQRN